MISQVMVAKKPGSPGRARRKPLKPLRGECRVNRRDRGDLSLCAFSFCAQGCGRVGAPGIPCALYRVKVHAKLGADFAREIAEVRIEPGCHSGAHREVRTRNLEISDSMLRIAPE